MSVAADAKRQRGRKSWQGIEANELMVLVLGLYEKQIRHDGDEFGVDESEVATRTAGMRDWAEFCGKQPDPEIRRAVRVEYFGRDDAPEIHRDGRGSCLECKGTGVYWSEVCEPKYHNHTKRKMPGFVVCGCGAGKILNAALKEYGRVKKSGGSRREDF